MYTVQCPQNPIDSYNSYITSINLAWISSLTFMNQDINQDRRSQAYIVIVNPRFHFWSHLPCSQDDFEPFFPAFLLYSGSVFTLLCGAQPVLEKAKVYVFGLLDSQKTHNFDQA